MASRRTLLLAFSKLDAAGRAGDRRLENKGILAPVVPVGTMSPTDIHEVCRQTWKSETNPRWMRRRRRWTVAPTKAELSTDVAGKAAGSGHYTSFDFDFLRLAIKLRQQPIDRRNHRRNVLR